MATARRSVAAVVVALGLGGVLGGCGGTNGTSAVCSDLQAVQQSVQELSRVTVGPDTLPTINSDIATIRQQLTTLKLDAKNQYSTEITALSDALGTLSDAATAARAAPSAANLSALVSAVTAVGAAASSLAGALKDTC